MSHFLSTSYRIGISFPAYFIFAPEIFSADSTFSSPNELLKIAPVAVNSAILKNLSAKSESKIFARNLYYQKIFYEIYFFGTVKLSGLEG